MSLKFKVVQRVNKFDAKNPKNYLKVEQAETERIDIDDLAREIAEDNTLAPFEVKGVLEKLVSTVIRHARYGHRVSIGDLGVIQPQIRSKGVKEGEEFSTAKHIRGVYPRFNPTNVLKEAFKSIKLQQVTEEECKAPGDKKKKPDHPAFDDPGKKPEEGAGGTGNAD